MIYGEAGSLEICYSNSGSLTCYSVSIELHVTMAITFIVFQSITVQI